MTLTDPGGTGGRVRRLPETAPRWTSLLALWAVAVGLVSLLYPRWRLQPLLGGGPIYSKRSITFGPGVVTALFLAVAAGCCISLTRNPARPAPRTAGGVTSLAAAFAASMVLAEIPPEAVGYSLTPTPGLRMGQVAIAAAALALLIPYGSVFQHRVLTPEAREASPHPARESLPEGLELDDEEPG